MRGCLFAVFISRLWRGRNMRWFGFLNSPVECGMQKTAERSEKVQNNQLMSGTCMHLRYDRSYHAQIIQPVPLSEPIKKRRRGKNWRGFSWLSWGSRSLEIPKKPFWYAINKTLPSAARQSKRITWHRTQTKPCRRRAEWIKRLMLLLKLMFHVRKASEGKFSRLTMMFFGRFIEMINQ